MQCNQRRAIDEQDVLFLVNSDGTSNVCASYYYVLSCVLYPVLCFVLCKSIIYYCLYFFKTKRQDNSSKHYSEYIGDIMVIILSIVGKSLPEVFVLSFVLYYIYDCAIIYLL